MFVTYHTLQILLRVLRIPLRLAVTRLHIALHIIKGSVIYHFLFQDYNAREFDETVCMGIILDRLSYCHNRHLWNQKSFRMDLLLCSNTWWKLIKLIMAQSRSIIWNYTAILISFEFELLAWPFGFYNDNALPLKTKCPLHLIHFMDIYAGKYRCRVYKWHEWLAP